LSLRGTSERGGSGSFARAWLASWSPKRRYAHATSEIDNIRWGVVMARKGAVPKDRVINTLDAADFAAWIAQRKARCRTVSGGRTRPDGERASA
jgi:hypothetical protein